jgi:hypothetical protein
MINFKKEKLIKKHLGIATPDYVVQNCIKMLNEFEDQTSPIDSIDSKMMSSRDVDFLDTALKYKREYDATSWWKFSKRIELKENWYNARECMVRYGKHKKR